MTTRTHPVDHEHFTGGSCAELVIVGAGDGIRTVCVTDLLPATYVWADHQL